MGFEAIIFEYINHLLKAITLGFLLETLFLFPILFVRNVPSYFKEADVAVVRMVKHIGLVWLCASIGYNLYAIVNFTADEAHAYHSRISGPYWFAYWLTSPFMFLLSQLLWVKWISCRWLPRVMIAILLAFSFICRKDHCFHNLIA